MIVEPPSTQTEEFVELDLDLLRQYAKDSLFFFAKGILGFDWLVPHIHGDVCLLLEDVSKRREKFVLPRGWLKTTNLRVLLAQNNQDNARKKLKVIREQFEQNELLRAMYPEVLPNSNCVWSASSLCLNRKEAHPESTFECIGVRGQPTSRHYNIIIEDDTVAPDFDELGQETLAPSHDDVRKAVAWHSLALPLLTNPSTDEIIVVGTRWYEYDLMSHIEKNEPQYTCIERSCLEDEDGNSDPRGMVTYPERFNRDVLTEYEATLGPYFFSTLMLNNPVAAGDMVFKAEWFKEYDVLPPRQSLTVYTTIDPATDPQLSTSRADDLDYSVVLTTAKDMITGDIYVLDYFRERCNPGDHAAAVFEQVLRWKPIVVGYENVAYQRSLEYWLKELMRQRGEYFLLTPIKRTGRQSKETFIMGLQPIAASETIHVRPWMTQLITEFLSFPRGIHDDLIDCLAMHTQLWKRTHAKAEYKQQIDPAVGFDLEAAIAELRGRHKQGRKSVVFDPERSASTIFMNAN
jgi:predicted phage terminase large subunit-like protein